MEYALSAYVDASRGILRAHCEHNQRSFELGFAAFETAIDMMLSFLPKSSAQRAIRSVTRSHFGDRAVIEADIPWRGAAK